MATAHYPRMMMMVRMLMWSMVVLLVGHGCHGLSRDGMALLDLKSTLIDPHGHLSSWNPSDRFPCQWEGVYCMNSSRQRVWDVDLSAKNLSGTLSPSIGNLAALRYFNISFNALTGAMPPEIGNLSRLVFLDLANNNITGIIPPEIGKLQALQTLHLMNNVLEGPVPPEIGNLTNMVEFLCYTNNLSGSLPPSLGNLGALRMFRAGQNALSGPIPPEIAGCANLELFGLAQNELTGHLPKELGLLRNLTSIIIWGNLLEGDIPAELGNLTHLHMLALYRNDFSGPVPPELGKLQELQKLYLYSNRLTGSIPASFGNLTSALEIDLSENNLTGSIPDVIFQLQSLKLLHLFQNSLSGTIPWVVGLAPALSDLDLSLNQLSGSFPTSLQNSTSIKKIQLFRNNLTGDIPPLLGSVSSLYILELSSNLFTGTIPPLLCSQGALYLLHLGKNLLTGTVPQDVFTCKSLQQLGLDVNFLTGDILPQLVNLTSLQQLDLRGNNFSGEIPANVGDLTALQVFSIADNNFNGTLPGTLGQLLNLVYLNVSGNAFTGTIPSEIGNCTQLQRLDLSNNLFSGELPSELGNLTFAEGILVANNQLQGSIPDALHLCSRLSYLHLGSNNFSGFLPVSLGQITTLQYGLNLSHNSLIGRIPEQLGDLNMLEMLDLSFNQLTGQIPATLSNLTSIIIFNVSYNQLSGALPSGSFFSKLNMSSLMGNTGLCGGPVLSACPFVETLPTPPAPTWQDSNVSTGTVVGIIAAVIGGAVLIIFIGACWFCRHPAALVPLPEKEMVDSIFLPRTGITITDVLSATENFSDATEIGRGACGKVYKAVMPSGKIIAVKKLSTQKDSMTQYDSFTAEIMTLGKIRHCNIVKLLGFCSYQGFNLLLYEYMPKGSLGELLAAENCELDWDLRYKIALGAAAGLAYLHHDCKPLIIHRDIKSNNILLDNCYEAHVGDFGLAKLMEFPDSKSMSAVAGSFGYIAPEYAYTMKVTEKCDIYSFGVVLLELLTGRSPIQPIDEGGDLVTWVKETMQKRAATSTIFDSRLDLTDVTIVEEMLLVLRVAVFCTSSLPSERPTMREVVRMLTEACTRKSRDSTDWPVVEDSCEITELRPLKTQEICEKSDYHQEDAHEKPGPPQAQELAGNHSESAVVLQAFENSGAISDQEASESYGSLPDVEILETAEPSPVQEGYDHSGSFPDQEASENTGSDMNLEAPETSGFLPDDRCTPNAEPPQDQG